MGRRNRHNLAINPTPSKVTHRQKGTHNSERLSEGLEIATPTYKIERFNLKALKPQLSDWTSEYLALKVNRARMHENHQMRTNLKHLGIAFPSAKPICSPTLLEASECLSESILQ